MNWMNRRGVTAGRTNPDNRARFSDDARAQGKLPRNRNLEMIKNEKTTNGIYSGQKIPCRERFARVVSAWRFRRGRFGMDVSAWTFRRRHFGDIKLSCSGTTRCPPWEPHIVLHGNFTSSHLETTNLVRNLRLWKNSLAEADACNPGENFLEIRDFHRIQGFLDANASG